MRKVKLQMQMTINGYVGGLKGENDWMTWNPDPELIAFFDSLLDTSDTLLLGRKLASGFIEHWENAAGKNPAPPFAKKNSGPSKSCFHQNTRQINLEQHHFSKRESCGGNCQFKKAKR